MSYAYEFRIAGSVSPDLLQTFTPDLAYRDADDTVFVRTVTDDSELFGVIARCEALRLRLVGLRQLDRKPDNPSRPDDPR